MKKILLSATAACFFLLSEAQLKTPVPSPAQTVKQEFALSSIELSYARPGLKGRKLYKDLAPEGKVWRTGANGATTLNFGEEVTIGGVKVPAGKYGLLSIPGKKSWTLIISKQTNVTSPAAYKEDMDVVRVTAPVKSVKQATETFTIQFANVKSESCEIQLLWDKAVVTLPISTNIDEKIMADIEKAMKTDKPPYFQAASYYLENGKDLNKALTWYDKAAELQPEAFWVQYQRASCLAKLGKTEEAATAANLSKDLAEKAKNDDYVKLNEKLLKELKK